MLAEERGVRIAWKTGMTLRVDGAAAVASRICQAIFERLADTNLTGLDLIFPIWVRETGVTPQVRSLLPLDHELFTGLSPGDVPMITLSPTGLLERLAEEYVYAQVCEAAMEAFAAENEARVASMSAAEANIKDMRAQLQAQERLVRQEEITAEVVDLARSSTLIKHSLTV
jgi:F-type H+-transporting ATPase subunit gamma